MTLVDGAVKNNLPTDILRHMGADVIIRPNTYDGNFKDMKCCVLAVVKKLQWGN